MPARAPVQPQQQQQQQQQKQKARPLNPSLRRNHHQTWTLVKNLPLMDAPRNPDQRPPNRNNKVNAVVQVHPSFRSEMRPPGPLDGSAELIYMTNIAPSPSNAATRPADAGKDPDELMFVLEYRPEIIRFWIDERPVGHPNVSKEIRKGVLDDSRNCSVIKVCLNGGARERRLSRDAPSAPKESDIYLPPSSRASRVWIYLDPSKGQDIENQQKLTPNGKGKAEIKAPTKPPASSSQRKLSLKKSQKPPQKSPPASSQNQQEQPLRKISQDQNGYTQEKKSQHSSTKALQKPPQAHQAPVSYGIPIPKRRSSKKATQRSPLAIHPPATISPSPPAKNIEDTSTEKREPLPTRKTSTRQTTDRTKNPSNTTDRTYRNPRTQGRRDISKDLEPVYLKNDVLNDISRLMTNSDPFGRFHSSFPDMTDSDDDEERDHFPESPFDSVPTLGQAQLGKFYKAGKRAQSSIFFEEKEAPPGEERKIEVSHVEKPEAKKREFAKPSRIKKLGMTLTGVWNRCANQK